MPLSDGATIDDVALVSSSTGEYNYCSVATAMGDLNGDGYDEFAIGCNGYSNFDGLVSVFYGEATPSSSTNAYSADLFILGPSGWGLAPGRPSRLVTSMTTGTPTSWWVSPAGVVSTRPTRDSGVLRWHRCRWRTTSGADGHVLLVFAVPGRRYGSRWRHMAMGTPAPDRWQWKQLQWDRFRFSVPLYSGAW